MGQVGQTSLAVVPTMKGFRQKVNAESKASAKAAGRGMTDEFGRTGVKAGRAMGRGFKSGSSSAEGALKSLTRTNAQATSAWSVANRKHMDTLGSVRVAQAKLTDATKKYGADSTQAITAQERLSSAQRKSEESALQLKTAQERLTEATKNLSAAQGKSRGMGDVWAKMKGDLAPVTSRVAALKTKLTEAFSTSKLGRGLTDMVGNVTSNLARATLGAYNFGEGLSKRVAAGASAAGKSISGAFGGFMNDHPKISAAFGKIGDTMKGLGAKAVGAGQMLGGIGQAAGTAGGVIGRALGPGLSSMWSGMTNQISGAATAFTSMLGGAAIATGAIIAGAMTKALVGGFSRLGNIENAQAKMKGLGFSATDIKGAMDGASAAVDGTAFALDEMADAASTAMAAGLKPGKELNGYMATLKNSASAAGAPLSEMGQILNKTLTSGKASTLEINQIAGRGLPIWSKLQDAYGVTADELKKMVSAGEVDTATFMKVMDDMTGSVADEMGGTTTSAIKNFGAALSKLGADMLQGVYPVIGPLFNALKSGVQMLQKLGAPAFEAMGEAMAPLAEKLTKFNELWAGAKEAIEDGVAPLTAIRGVFEQMGMSIDGPLSAFGKIKDAFDSLGAGIAPVIGGLLGALGPLLARIPMIGGAFTGLTGPVGIFLGLLVAMWQESEVFREAIGTVFDALMDSLGPVFDALSPLLASLGDAFTTVAKVLGDVVGEALLALIPLFDPIMETLAVLIEALGPVLDLIGPLAEVIGDALVQALVALTPLMAMFGDLITLLQPIIVLLVGVIAQLLEALVPLLAPLGDLIANFLPPLISLFGAVLTPIMKLAGVVLSALIPVIMALLDILVGLINFVVGVFTGDWDKAWKGVKMMFVGFKDAIWGIVKGIGSIFTGLIDTIMGIFGGVGGWLVDSGKALIQGFIDGIMTGFKWAGDKISEGLDFVKGFFPNSPAKRGPLSSSGWRKLRTSGGAFAAQWVGGAEDGLEAFDLPNLIDGAGPLGRLKLSGREAAERASITKNVNVNNEINMYDRDPRIVGKQVGREIEKELV